jgi:hypothetical protein
MGGQWASMSIMMVEREEMMRIVVARNHNQADYTSRSLTSAPASMMQAMNQ